MIRKLFIGKVDSITVAAFVIAVSSLISRLLGLIRDHILAGNFGAGNTLDIYYAAFRIPDLVFNLLVLGAISAGFIPVLSKLIKIDENPILKIFFKDENKEAWQLVNSLMNSAIICLMILCGIGMIFAFPIMKFLTPGFSPEKQLITAQVSKIIFISPLLLGISSILGGILQSFKRFFIYSLAPIFYNIGIIIGAIWFAPIWGVFGLAWGVVLGAFLHMIIQIPTAHFLGYKYRPFISFKDNHFKKLTSMIPARILTLSITQINLVAMTVIASTLAIGSMTVFNFANNLQSFPIGIFGISFATAAFPTISANAFNREKLVSDFSLVFRQILFFIIPSTVLLYLLRAQLVRVILGSGQFNWEDTELTLQTLGFFTISLFAQSTVPLLIRIYYARYNTKTPFIIGLITMVINVFLSLTFAKILGVAGLALGFSVAAIINFIILWIMLKSEIGNLDEKKIVKSTAIFLIASLGCGVVVQGMKILVSGFVNMQKFWGIFLQGAMAGAIGIGVYIGICYLLQSEELMNFIEAFKRKLPWKKLPPEDQGEARGV